MNSPPFWNAKSKDQDYKLLDGYCLFLLVTPTGGKLWRLDYRIGNKRKTMALGQYPAVSLADARKRREDARKLLANGQDPVAVKKPITKSCQITCFMSIYHRYLLSLNFWTRSIILKSGLARLHLKNRIFYWTINSSLVYTDLKSTYTRFAHAHPNKTAAALSAFKETRPSRRVSCF